MLIRRVGEGIAVSTPAKLNLFLEVLARRDDGFHEIETLMTTISVFDTLCFFPVRTLPSDFESTAHRPISSLVHLECRLAYGSRGGQLGVLPPPDENLVQRAVLRLIDRWGSERAECKPAKMVLIKRIPAAAGLGGASSDAAAALTAARLAWRIDCSDEQLCELACELGSDIPFFLDRIPSAHRIAERTNTNFNSAIRPAICRGRGEKIERVEGLPRLHVVVVQPPQGLSTPEVYHRCKPAESPRTAVDLMNALRQGSLSATKEAMGNRLEEPASSLSPAIAQLRSELFESGCWAAQMSGSGAACFGLFRSARQARRAAARLRARRLGWVVSASSTC